MYSIVYCSKVLPEQLELVIFSGNMNYFEDCLKIKEFFRKLKKYKMYRSMHEMSSLVNREAMEIIHDHIFEFVQ